MNNSLAKNREYTAHSPLNPTSSDTRTTVEVNAHYSRENGYPYMRTVKLFIGTQENQWMRAISTVENEDAAALIVDALRAAFPEII